MSRYPSDTSDAEWVLIEPLLPEPACETRTGAGRRSTRDARSSTGSAMSLTPANAVVREAQVVPLPSRVTAGVLVR